MKIFVDNNLVLELNNTQKNIIKNEINPDIFVSDMERRVAWVLSHKLDQCYSRLFTHWLPILQQRYESLPSNKNSFAELVFVQPDYKPEYPIETPIEE